MTRRGSYLNPIRRSTEVFDPVVVQCGDTNQMFANALPQQLQRCCRHIEVEGSRKFLFPASPQKELFKFAVLKQLMSDVLVAAVNAPVL